MRFPRRAFVLTSAALVLGGCSLVISFDRSLVDEGRGSPATAVADEDATAPAPLDAADAPDAFDGALPATNMFIVAVGGLRNGLEKNDVYVTRINGDGTLAPWTTAAPFPVARLSVGISAVGSSILVTGGAGDEAVAKTTYVGSFSGGTVTGWLESTPLPNDLFRHGSFAHGGRIYLVGGEDGVDLRSDVLVATPLPSGGSGAWTTTESMPRGRTAGVVVASGNHVYVVGGAESEDGGTVNTGAGLAADLLADGGVMGWRAVTSLPFVTTYAAGAATSTQLFVSGGYGAPSGFTAVVSAPIVANGALGGWSIASPLNIGRAGHAMIVARGRLYVIGGQQQGGVDSDSVELADINPDGTLTPFRQTSRLPSGRAFIGATLVEP